MAYKILVPWLGIEPGPLQWKHRVLITGLPGIPTFSHLLLLVFFFSPSIWICHSIFFWSGKFMLENLLLSYGDPLVCNISLSFFSLLLIFKSLSLSFTFNSLIIMCPGVALLRFNIFGVLWCSWIWIFNLKSILSDISVATPAFLGYYCLKISLYFFHFKFYLY